MVAASSPHGRLEAHAGRLSVAADALRVESGTRYDLASVTKTYVSVAVVRLVEDGALGLEEPAGRYLPDLPPDKRGLTLHRLLAHTAGMAPGAAVAPRPDDAEAMRHRVIDLPLGGRGAARSSTRAWATSCWVGFWNASPAAGWTHCWAS